MSNLRLFFVLLSFVGLFGGYAVHFYFKAQVEDVALAQQVRECRVAQSYLRPAIVASTIHGDDCIPLDVFERPEKYFKALDVDSNTDPDAYRCSTGGQLLMTVRNDSVIVNCTIDGHN